MNEQQAANRLLVIGGAGLAALAALTIWVGPHSAAQLQGKISASANEALATGGHGWATAVASGQHVALEGVAPSDREKASAMTAVGAAAGVSGVAADKVDVAPVVSPYRLVARKDASGVKIEGVAPTRSAMKAINDSAAALYGSPTINLTLASGAPQGVSWDVAAIQGLDALKRLDSGELVVEDAGLRVSGVAPTDAIADEVRDKLSRPSEGVTVTTDVRSVEELAKADTQKLAACSEAFANVAQRRSIVFASQSARLTSQGNRALESLIETARGCTAFTIGIEAHTDATGRRASNMQLSEQRAEAVKAYFVMRGIPEDRLTTRGFGPDKPVASNRNERGRAANRRIEFRITSGDKDR